MMKRILTAALVITVFVLTSAESCEPGASILDGSATLEESNMFALINQKRAEVGCKALIRDQQLANAAYRQVADMRDHNLQEHAGTDGSTPESRIKDAGFAPTSKTGEIMYWASEASDYKAAVEWWKKSEPHWNIIKDCAFTHAGFGVLYPEGTRYYAVGDFATH